MQKAKAKAILAEETSDLTSDGDAKRIHKRKKFFDDDENSSSHNSHNSSFEDEISSNLKLPEPPNSTGIGILQFFKHIMVNVLEVIYHLVSLQKF